jgi:hypothetical protein
MLYSTYMPERQRGRDPNKKRGGEQQEKCLPEYQQAARYVDESSSEAAYDEAQRAIYETPCNLSTYRLLSTPDVTWHVAVLGDVPSDELHRRLTTVLATGESVVLPNDVLIALYEHRRKQPAIDGWAERHYLLSRRLRTR